MPDSKTIERLRGLILSANDLKALSDWPDALIEDYLNIVDNLILLANTLDVETDKNLESLIYSIPENKSYDSTINDIKKLFFSKPVNKDFEARISGLEKYIYAMGLITPPFTYYLKEIVWDDLRFPASSVKGGGAFDTTPIAYKGGIVEAFSTGPNNESVQFIAQLPHGYKDDDHILTDIVNISGTGKKISSMLICSLTRDVGVANDYADDAYFLEADFHYEINTVGSRLEMEK